MFLIGAGGHARLVAEALSGAQTPPTAYVDSNSAKWIKMRRINCDADALAEPACSAAMGLGGARPEDLRFRLDLIMKYLAAGFDFPVICHPGAFISPSAEIDPGAIVLAGAIVNPGVRLSQGCIINSGAIVEHDSYVGEGAHIAPGSIVLGGASIGECTMVGAGSTILPGMDVKAGTLVPALTRFPK